MFRDNFVRSCLITIESETKGFVNSHSIRVTVDVFNIVGDIYFQKILETLFVVLGVWCAAIELREYLIGNFPCEFLQFKSCFILYFLGKLFRFVYDSVAGDEMKGEK